MARFVAAVWGNVGPALLPWHLIEARPYLTDDFAAAVATTRQLDGGVEIGSQVMATTMRGSGSTVRITVTLEQTQSVAGAVGQRTALAVIELVLVNDEAGWLVGSLERVA